MFCESVDQNLQQNDIRQSNMDNEYLPYSINFVPTREWVLQQILVYRPNRIKDSQYIRRIMKIAKYKYMRTRLSEAQNHKCCYCGVETVDIPNTRKSFTIDHVIPKSRGGINHWNNYVMACGRCNNKRQSKSAEQFYEKSSKSDPKTIQSQKLDPKTSSSHKKPCRIARSNDSREALATVESSDCNPFEPGTRIWKMFERYKNNSNIQISKKYSSGMVNQSSNL